MTLSSKDLAYMRSSIEELLPDTCNIMSSSGTADGMGGYTDSWGTAYASVACRLDTLNGNYRDANSGIITYQKLVFTLPQSTAIVSGHRIIYSGNTYNVSSVKVGSWLGCKRAEVELI
jgi:hypothetical protein